MPSDATFSIVIAGEPRQFHRARLRDIRDVAVAVARWRNPPDGEDPIGHTVAGLVEIVSIAARQTHAELTIETILDSHATHAELQTAVSIILSQYGLAERPTEAVA